MALSLPFRRAVRESFLCFWTCAWVATKHVVTQIVVVSDRERLGMLPEVFSRGHYFPTNCREFLGRGECLANITVSFFFSFFFFLYTCVCTYVCMYAHVLYFFLTRRNSITFTILLE